METLHFLLVAAGDIGIAKHHEIFDIIARLKEQAAHRAIGHRILYQIDGTHVQIHHFLDVLHFFVKGHLHLGEDTRHHLGTYIVVIPESPSCLRIPLLASGFADVVQQRCPAKPES